MNDWQVYIELAFKGAVILGTVLGPIVGWLLKRALDTLDKHTDMLVEHDKRLNVMETTQYTPESYTHDQRVQQQVLSKLEELQRDIAELRADFKELKAR